MAFDSPDTNSTVSMLQTLLSASRGSVDAVAEAPRLGLMGTSCMLPRGATSLLFLARAAVTASDMVANVPATRWNTTSAPTELDATVVDRTRHGAFICSAQAFDNVRFAVSSAEAGAMDPQHRVLLEGGYAALHASGSDEAATTRYVTRRPSQHA